MYVYIYIFKFKFKPQRDGERVVTLNNLPGFSLTPLLKD